jgi:hypothetical protein
VATACYGDSFLSFFFFNAIRLVYAIVLSDDINLLKKIFVMMILNFHFS